MTTQTSKLTANERLRAFSAERESLIKREGKKEGVDLAEYQKNVRAAQEERLKAMGVVRVHPYLSNQLVEYVGVIASSLQVTRPVAIGAIVSAFLDKAPEDQHKILDQYRDDFVESSSPVLPKVKEKTSKFTRHDQRQKIQGRKRKFLYLTEADLERLNLLKDRTDYGSQGNLVNAILEEFFEKKQPHSRPVIIKEHSLEI